MSISCSTNSILLSLPNTTNRITTTLHVSSASSAEVAYFEACNTGKNQMAYMRLGSKPEAFHLEGQTWIATSGLPSDISIEVGTMSFNLHKFPLLSRSGLLEKLIADLPSEEGSVVVLKLHDIPGGSKAFELTAKFCYGVKIELNASNVVSLRCAAEFLMMTEEFGEGNLISQTEAFLTEAFGNWADSLKALRTCEEVLPCSEEVHIVSRCIDSLAIKACADPNMFSLPVPGDQVSVPSQVNVNVVVWNGIAAANKPPQQVGEDWWFDDVSYLRFPFYRRLILAVESRGMKPETISSSLMHYARKYLPLMNRQAISSHQVSPGSGTTGSTPSEMDQRILLEEIVVLLPNQKGVTPTNFMLGLLRTGMLLHASPSCRENLEKRIGSQLDQAVLVDLLIPNMGYSVETLYDIDCVQRILDHFLMANQEAALLNSPSVIENGQFVDAADSLTPMSMVASLVDGFLAEVAPDVNLKLPKFEVLAATIPDYARPIDDGLYHAIDVYLKAHPWLTDPEREQLCRLMNCQKLSLEASTHAAQNERLPLRVIVQVLFFEQLRLRTTVSGWFFVSENLDNPQNPAATLGLPKNRYHPLEGRAADDHHVKERVSELEKECMNIKQELQKLAKTKRGWKAFAKRLGLGPKPSCNTKESCDLKEPAFGNSEKQNPDKGDSVH